MEDNKLIAALIWVCAVHTLGDKGNPQAERPLITKRHPPVNHSGPFLPEVSRIIQIETSSRDLRINLYALSEDFQSGGGTEGFNPEAMLRTAYANSNSDITTFSADMGEMLRKFLCHHMSAASFSSDRFFDNNFKKLLARYKFVDQPVGAAHVPLAPDDFTLFRLAASFPYETAQIRFRNMETTWLPGLTGNLSYVLAFPFAPLIIPASWSETREQWRKWYATFSAYMAGYPLPDKLKRRQEKQYQSMTLIAKEQEKALLEKMQLLGIEELYN